MKQGENEVRSKKHPSDGSSRRLSRLIVERRSFFKAQAQVENGFILVL